MCIYIYIMHIICAHISGVDMAIPSDVVIVRDVDVDPDVVSFQASGKIHKPRGPSLDQCSLPRKPNLPQRRAMSSLQVLRARLDTAAADRKLRRQKRLEKLRAEKAWRGAVARGELRRPKCPSVTYLALTGRLFSCWRLWIFVRPSGSRLRCTMGLRVRVEGAREFPKR